MKILLFGGTFDPPHNGHIQLLKSAIAAVEPSRVVVMPAGTPPHKAASATPAALRLAMCRCFLPLFSPMEISDWEITRTGKSYTIDTVRMLHSRWPQAQLYLSVGSDMLETFTEWSCWRQLLGLATLVVHSRYAGDEPRLKAAADALRAEGGQVLFTGAPVLEATSSQLRTGRLDESLVPPEALAVIRANHLYERETDSMELEQAEALAKGRLSPKRFIHTQNVRDAAVELAQKYGADPYKAALAALLHDTAKELPRAQLLQILTDNAIIAKNTAQSPPPVWHGPCAAILAQTQWGVNDQEVLDAISCHTTGRPGMTKLDKILYLSDMISAERSYPEVHELRRLAAINLDTATLRAMQRNLQWMEECAKPVDPLSRQALQNLEREAALHNLITKEQSL